MRCSYRMNGAAALVVAAACVVFATSAQSQTFGGYFTGGYNEGGDVALDWSSDLGPDYRGGWGLTPSSGPYSGHFSSFIQRNDFGPASAGTVADIPAAGTGLPAHLHYVTDLINYNHNGTYGLYASNWENVYVTLTESTPLNWLMDWSVSYTSDGSGVMNFTVNAPNLGYVSLVPNAAYAGGFYDSGSLSGVVAGNATGLGFGGSLCTKARPIKQMATRLARWTSTSAIRPFSPLFPNQKPTR